MEILSAFSLKKDNNRIIKINHIKSEIFPESGNGKFSKYRNYLK